MQEGNNPVQSCLHELYLNRIQRGLVIPECSTESTFKFSFESLNKLQIEQYRTFFEGKWMISIVKLFQCSDPIVVMNVRSLMNEVYSDSQMRSHETTSEL